MRRQPLTDSCSFDPVRYVLQDVDQLVAKRDEIVQKDLLWTRVVGQEQVSAASQLSPQRYLGAPKRDNPDGPFRPRRHAKFCTEFESALFDRLCPTRRTSTYIEPSR